MATLQQANWGDAGRPHPRYRGASQRAIGPHSATPRDFAGPSTDATVLRHTVGVRSRFIPEECCRTVHSTRLTLYMKLVCRSILWANPDSRHHESGSRRCPLGLGYRAGGQSGRPPELEARLEASHDHRPEVGICPLPAHAISSPRRHPERVYSAPQRTAGDVSGPATGQSAAHFERVTGCGACI